ncbi:hypothetical protein JCM11251_006349 [Rhodosporidiobolus azoricus]
MSVDFPTLPASPHRPAERAREDDEMSGSGWGEGVTDRGQVEGGAADDESGQSGSGAGQADTALDEAYRAGRDEERDSGPLPATISTADRPHYPFDVPATASPTSPRMRRAPRLSPNSRMERPAPSALPSSTFSASSFAIPSRSTRRRGSLPPPPSRRARASSLEPPGAPRHEAETSRSRRHLDPDEHWLSEDEASEHAQTFFSQRGRSGPRRPRPPRRNDSDSDPPKVLSGEFGTATTAGHAIHQRPAKAFQSPTLSTTSPQLAASPPTPTETILRALVPLLTCPSCHHLLRSPTTLSCGHSMCFTCGTTTPKVSTPVGSPPSAGMGAVGAASPLGTPPLESASPVPWPVPIPGAFLHRTDSLASTVSTSSATSHRSAKRPSLDLPQPNCAQPGCTITAFSASLPHTSLHVDFTLRKVVDLVARALPSSSGGLGMLRLRGESGLESLLSEASISPQSHGKGISLPEPGHIPRTGSGESGSSGGGEDETRVEDDGKRMHKSSDTWKASKKTRVVESDSSSSRPVTPMPPLFAGSASSPPAFLNELQAELECQVCVQLLHDPVTTSCGHSFCRACLARAYDHSDKCPLCRANLPPFTFFRSQRSNAALATVIDTALPVLAAERAAAVKEEELASMSSVPVFICTAAYPGIKTFLHIFEPRYRLMIRRALETPTQSFGMVLPLKTPGGGQSVNEYGTMLRITSSNVLEDGRMLIETVGTHRFRLLERGMLDGYTVGRIERVDDVSPEQEAELERAALARNEEPDIEWAEPGQEGPSRPPMTGNVELDTEQLMRICLDFIRTLRAGSAPWVVERLNRTVGEIPTDPSAFTWFAAEVFPVEDHVKVTLLQITSVRERLRLIVFWIEQFRSSWWYTRGCSVS